MEVPEVRCEQCGERIVLSPVLATRPEIVTPGGVVTREREDFVAFWAQKCRCPDPAGS